MPSSFVRKPIDKRLNKGNIFSKLERLERLQTPTPTQGFDNLSELVPDAANVVQDDEGQITTVNNEGATLTMSEEVPTPHNKMIPAETDLMADSVGAVAPFTMFAFNSGTAASIAGDTEHPGVIRFTNGATANGGARIMWYENTSSILLKIGACFETIVKFQTDATQFVGNIGYFDSFGTGANVDAVYWNCTGTTGSGQVTAQPTILNNSSGNVANAAFLTTGVWYRLKLEITSDSTAVFSAWTCSDNALYYSQTVTYSTIPNSAGRETTAGVKAYRTTNASTTLIDVDYLKCWNSGTLSR